MEPELGGDRADDLALGGGRDRLGEFRHVERGVGATELAALGAAARVEGVLDREGGEVAPVLQFGEEFVGEVGVVDEDVAGARHVAGLRDQGLAQRLLLRRGHREEPQEWGERLRHRLGVVLEEADQLFVQDPPHLFQGAVGDRRASLGPEVGHRLALDQSGEHVALDVFGRRLAVGELDELGLGEHRAEDVGEFVGRDLALTPIGEFDRRRGVGPIAPADATAGGEHHDGEQGGAESASVASGTGCADGHGRPG